MTTLDAFSESSFLQVFTVNPEDLLPIDAAAQLARMPRRLVLVCCRHGLVTPHHDPVDGGFYFSRHAIRTLQRIEYLRTSCGVNLAGVELILKLMEDIAELRAISRR